MAGRVMETYMAEVRRIEKTNGHLDESILIEEGADAQSPIHPFFTWDEQEAAHKCRVQEARQLILVYARTQQRGPVVREVVLVAPATTERRAVYERESVAMQDPTKRAFVLGNAHTEYRAAAAKFAAYLRLYGTQQELDDFEQDTYRLLGDLGRGTRLGVAA